MLRASSSVANCAQSLPGVVAGAGDLAGDARSEGVQTLVERALEAGLPCRALRHRLVQLLDAGLQRRRFAGVTGERIAVGVELTPNRSNGLVEAPAELLLARRTLSIGLGDGGVSCGRLRGRPLTERLELAPHPAGMLGGRRGGLVTTDEPVRSLTEPVESVAELFSRAG